MNVDYILSALCFHGQPMQKIWVEERGVEDLKNLGVPTQPNYSTYQERQKHFTFQDRAKRLKLHQFFSRKASDLYDKELKCSTVFGSLDEKTLEEYKSHIAIMPPYEVFINKNQDKMKRWRCVLESIKPGDIIYGVVIKIGIVGHLPMVIKPLCTGEPLVRYLSDISTKAYVSYANIITPSTTNGKPRNFAINDFVCCEVLEVSVDADRLFLGMEGMLTKNKNIKLGLVHSEDLPAYYHKANDNATQKYDDCLKQAKEMLNPNYDILYKVNGLDINDTFSMMNSLKSSFPISEYAKELRQTQASKWAFRSVAEGIEYFKKGNQTEAFQCLNKALSIDPRNVEGLVARGAFYANKGSFLKAVDDFEKALKLNSFHVNARKYMGETLVALGRSYEEDNRIKEAAKAYMDCLNIIPDHEQARISLDAIQQRSSACVFENMLSISGSNNQENPGSKKPPNNSSSTSDDGSSCSGINSSDDTSSDSSKKKQASLSPLSKRMALHAASLEANEAKNQFHQPFFMTSTYNNTNRQESASNANEFKLDEDDTEMRVKKLLQKASKHKKEKKKKTKSKKIDKNLKKDKDNTVALLEKIDFQKAYRDIGGLQIENKINENLQKYEKTIAEIKKRHETLEQSTSSAASSSYNRNSQRRNLSGSPPPKPPSMTIKGGQSSSTRFPPTYSYGRSSNSTTTSPSHNEAPKFSFQIKKPVKVDKFGLVRIATPLTQRSPTASPAKSYSCSRSPSPYRRSRSRSRENRSRKRRYTRSRSSSYDHRRYKRSHSSRSRSNSRSRSRTSSTRKRRSREVRNFYGNRRTPSPFVPRNTPPPRRRSRSREHLNKNRRPRSRSPTKSNYKHQSFGNRVWHKSNYIPTEPSTSSALTDDRSSDGRWLHDKYDDGPSIEEIDEIIDKAQKERKQEIIKRDKEILKKSTDNY